MPSVGNSHKTVEEGLKYEGDASQKECETQLLKPIQFCHMLWHKALFHVMAEGNQRNVSAWCSWRTEKPILIAMITNLGS